MEEYELNALKAFAKLMHGNAILTSALIKILKTEVQPGGKNKPYEGSLYPGIMGFIYVFDKKPKIYANCDEFNPASDNDQRTPSAALRQHFTSFAIKKDGTPRGEETYVPPYFMWFCSLPAQCEKDELRNRREIAKDFYNKVLEQTPKSKIPDCLRTWDNNWSPPWIGVQPYPVFHTWEAVRDKIEGKSKPGIVSPPKSDSQSSEIKRDILDPYNPNGIEFFGRENEIQRLNAFAYDTEEFKIWTVIAPSGAGKTRLVFEWTQREAIKDHWEVFYLGQTPKGELVFHDPDHVYKNPHRADSYFKNVLENGVDWEYWSPKQDTILIIDYVSGFEEIINGIVNRCVRRNTGLDKRVRLLVLDHIFPVSLKKLGKDQRWALIEDVIDRSSVFHEPEPLFINTTDDQSDVMEKIIRSAALRPKEDGTIINLYDKQIKQAINYLDDPKKIKGTWHPLFAVLVGNALREKKSYDKLDRRKLIEAYLKDKNRLPWKYPKIKDKVADKIEERNRLWASAFVSAATILGGIDWQNLVEHDYSGFDDNLSDFAPIKSICQRVISKQIQGEFEPFTPDIIGESFFLLFLEQLSYRPQLKKLFYHILTIGDEEIQSKKALGFITVARRLTRNILNDDQSQEETQNDWDNLYGFFNPPSQKVKPEIKSLLSLGMIEVADLLFDYDDHRDNGPPHSSRFLDEINIVDILKLSHREFYRYSGNRVLKYFQLVAERRFITDGELKQLFEYLDRYDSSEPDTPAICLSTLLGFHQLTEQLLINSNDVYAQTKDGWTALMILCQDNESHLALKFIHRMDDYSHTTDDGWSALMLSCRYSMQKVSLAIIKKMNETEIKNAQTANALSMACRYNKNDVAIALVNAGVNSNYPLSDKSTPFFFACEAGDMNVISLMISRGADINTQDELGQTPLHGSSFYGHVDVVRHLLQEGAKINPISRIDGECCTPLDLAISEKQVAVIDVLKEAGGKSFSNLMV